MTTNWAVVPAPEIQKEALSLTERASLMLVGEYILAAAALEKKIKEYKDAASLALAHAPIKKATEAAHDAACAAEAKALAERPGRGIYYACRFVCAGCLKEICTACSPGTSGLCETCVNKQKAKEKHDQGS